MNQTPMIARRRTTPALTTAAGTVAKVAAVAAVYEAAGNAFDRIKTTWRNHFAYTVTVTENDPIYVDVQTWLLDLIPEEHHRALMVGTNRRNYGHEPATPGAVSGGDELRVTYNDSSSRTIRIDGHPVTIHLNRPEAKGDDASKYGEPEKIVFTARTKTAQTAVLAHLNRIHDTRRQARKPRLMMIGPWGDWTNRDDIPTRPLDSVVLPAGQKSRIVDDMGGFLAAETTYNDLAIPWHRGYLFHGPPGTGKTSLVKALASQFDLDLWYISLSDLKSEASLMSLIARVEPRSLLLLEDIDTIKISHDRDTDQGSISMSSLLNALDGVATPHGLITVMTTNHRDQLDPALTRAGRMDVIEELQQPSWVEIGTLFERFYNEPLNLSIRHPQTQVSMAEISELFKRHLDDPDAVRDLITSADRTGATL